MRQCTNLGTVTSRIVARGFKQRWRMLAVSDLKIFNFRIRIQNKEAKTSQNTSHPILNTINTPQDWPGGERKQIP